MSLHIDPELGAVVGDRDVIARQVVSSRTARGKTVTTTPFDLEQAITGLSISDTMSGSSTITVTLEDEGWEILDSGLFDAEEDGRLDPVDLNYPDGSRFWWRLTQVTLSEATRRAATVELTFMERAAAHLMAHRGPLKVSRAKKTRAEFIAMLASKVKAGGGITFVSQDLHKRQPIEGQEPDTKQRDDNWREVSKAPGISNDELEDLKIGGGAATRKQAHQVVRALNVADQLKAPRRAVIAMLCAGIGESGFKAVMNYGGSPYGGVFQGNVRGGVFSIDDTEGMAKCFLKGGKGFQGGGAIHLASIHPDWGPGLIAVTVEGSRSNFGSDQEAEHHYGQWRSEAEDLLAAYGGGGFGGTTYNKQFNFEVGTATKPRETYWDAMQRLGVDDVGWALFLDGQYLYFDPETTLIKQQPAAVIRRGQPTVIRFSMTWDHRQIATECELELVCDPFEFRAGQVFTLKGFGPASSGSTAKLPGRWLIAEVQRDRYGVSSVFTLRQPHAPDPEPAAERGQRDDAGTPGGDVDGTAKSVIDKIVIPIANATGVNKTAMGTPLNPANVVTANHAHNVNTTSGNRSDHAGPADVAWAADMSNGTSPTPEMDRLARRLAERFDLPWSGSGEVHKEAFGYRFQMLYRTMIGGNHFNHVHFGVEVRDKLEVRRRREAFDRAMNASPGGDRNQ